MATRSAGSADWRSATTTIESMTTKLRALMLRETMLKSLPNGLLACTNLHELEVRCAVRVPRVVRLACAIERASSSNR